MRIEIDYTRALKEGMDVPRLESLHRLLFAQWIDIRVDGRLYTLASAGYYCSSPKSSLGEYLELEPCEPCGV